MTWSGNLYQIVVFYVYFIISSAPFVHSVSECIATSEDLSNFECYTRKGGDVEGLQCEDTDPRCDEWGKRGECSKNPQYMLIYCRKACESCITGHHGEIQVAPDSTTRKNVLELIMETQVYLKEQAEFKARILRNCRNQDKFCAHYAVMGECEKNPEFMNANCAPACKTCN